MLGGGMDPMCYPVFPEKKTTRKNGATKHVSSSNLGLAQLLQDLSLGLGGKNELGSRRTTTATNDVASGWETTGWLENVQKNHIPNGGWIVWSFLRAFARFMVPLSTPLSNKWDEIHIMLILFSPWNMVMFSSSPQKEDIESILGKPPTLYQWSSWRLVVLAPS